VKRVPLGRVWMFSQTSFLRASGVQVGQEGMSFSSDMALSTISWSSGDMGGWRSTFLITTRDQGASFLNVMPVTLLPSWLTGAKARAMVSAAVLICLTVELEVNLIERFPSLVQHRVHRRVSGARKLYENAYKRTNIMTISFLTDIQIES